MGKYLDIFLGLPKTFIMNFHYFDFKIAIHFPILVGRRVKIDSLGDKGAVICKHPTFGIIRLGLSSGSYDLGKNNITRWSLQKGGRIKVDEGQILINQGTGVYVGSQALLDFKGKFFCNANCLISANCSISFGEDTLIGWNCNIIDGDGHRIIYCNNEQRKVKRDIVIGNHVWIGSGTTILKGVQIGNDSVIAMNSHITKSFGDKQLVAGNKIVRNDITWEH